MHFFYPPSLPITDCLEQLRELISAHQIVIVAGETGSGKTTTLHSCVGAINTPERKIKPQHGGPISVGRELLFNAAGKLGVRPLPELVAAIREPAHNAALEALRH